MLFAKADKAKDKPYSGAWDAEAAESYHESSFDENGEGEEGHGEAILIESTDICSFLCRGAISFVRWWCVIPLIIVAIWASLFFTLALDWPKWQSNHIEIKDCIVIGETFTSSSAYHTVGIIRDNVTYPFRVNDLQMAERKFSCGVDDNIYDLLEDETMPGDFISCYVNKKAWEAAGQHPAAYRGPVKIWPEVVRFCWILYLLPSLLIPLPMMAAFLAIVMCVWCSSTHPADVKCRQALCRGGAASFPWCLMGVGVIIWLSVFLAVILPTYTDDGVCTVVAKARRIDCLFCWDGASRTPKGAINWCTSRLCEPAKRADLPRSLYTARVEVDYVSGSRSGFAVADRDIVAVPERSSLGSSTRDAKVSPFLDAIQVGQVINCHVGKFGSRHVYLRDPAERSAIKAAFIVTTILLVLSLLTGASLLLKMNQCCSWCYMDPKPSAIGRASASLDAMMSSKEPVASEGPTIVHAHKFEGAKLSTIFGVDAAAAPTAKSDESSLPIEGSDVHLRASEMSSDLAAILAEIGSFDDSDSEEAVKRALVKDKASGVPVVVRAKRERIKRLVNHVESSDSDDVAEKMVEVKQLLNELDPSLFHVLTHELEQVKNDDADAPSVDVLLLRLLRERSSSSSSSGIDSDSDSESESESERYSDMDESESDSEADDEEDSDEEFDSESESESESESNKRARRAKARSRMVRRRK
ncbi:uncharacterized protein AMSG_11384 [Thecamonas trahens ATCC 50062]|uniref:Uncharacterized protein n=1 Tax=Thecamonas trahens ATCC 50062 TaxID=461836 RepID=A0A0L0DUN9_THETB|nr:hypothetical protein AMSG_11384 [Thecamonas trahens ATCC 50062]KNC55917.1 hypothetical protein AMSG_11384 [Thecamonas trahens ATCC 50062]|eukprot:XP_013752735.1 hypothetical protein AMSG_11384 [Thecamonas trahens ATCC 50062]